MACKSFIVCATSLGGALSRALHTWRRVSSLNCPDLGMYFARWFNSNSAWMSFSGFQPAKSSNFESAIAISGLCIVSPYFSGCSLCSCAASFRSGWICRGSALLKDRIWTNVSLSVCPHNIILGFCACLWEKWNLWTPSSVNRLAH